MRDKSVKNVLKKEKIQFYFFSSKQINDYTIHQLKWKLFALTFFQYFDKEATLQLFKSRWLALWTREVFSDITRQISGWIVYLDGELSPRRRAFRTRKRGFC